MLLHRSAVALCVIVTTACGAETTGPDGPSEDSPVGRWQATAANVSESSVDFRADGSFTWVEADLVGRVCSSAEGQWSVSSGVLTTTVTERDGAGVSESPQQWTFTTSASALVLNGTTHGTVGVLPVCEDYGWMRMVMFADIDGVTTDLSWRALFEVDLADEIADGSIDVNGFVDPDGVGLDPSCDRCMLLEMELFHELGIALTSGAYPVENFGPTGLRSEATLTPDFSQSTVTYGSNDSDPLVQPWVGEVVISTLSADVLAGTFELTLYRADGTGPPLPTMTVTNGSFRLSFD